ncbi:hypothetical protein NBRC116494_33210 [Aurantivibrio plasticivorans]
MKQLSLHRYLVSVVIISLLFAGGCTSYRPESAVVEDETAPAGRVLPTKASDQMLVQAQQALSGGDSQSAIAFAERGLRIDRRNSELYMVLAKAYTNMDDLNRAAQFAEQAVRFASPGSDVEQASRDYLSFLKKRR